jgi:hypothetical protein
MAEGVEQRVVLGRSASQTAREKAQRFPPVLVMAHPSMEYLAENLVSRVDELEKKGEKERYRSVELWNKISWKTFRDKWPDIFIKDVEEIAGRDVIFVASFDSPSVIFEQLSLIYSLPRYLVRSFRLILPFFPTGTMERVDKEGQVVTAKVCTFRPMTTFMSSPDLPRPLLPCYLRSLWPREDLLRSSSLTSTLSKKGKDSKT